MGVGQRSNLQKGFVVMERIPAVKAQTAGTPETGSIHISTNKSSKQNSPTSDKTQFKPRLHLIIAVTGCTALLVRAVGASDL